MLYSECILTAKEMLGLVAEGTRLMSNVQEMSKYLIELSWAKRVSLQERLAFQPKLQVTRFYLSLRLRLHWFV